MLHMIDPDTALRLVLEHTPAPHADSVRLEESLGYRLAEPVVADRDYPPFRRATMDGYAVRASDAGKSLRIEGELAAGDVWRDPLPAGAAVEIMTGAPCPEGSDAVVQKEAVTLAESGVRIPESVTSGMNIVSVGAECERGRVVLDRGTLITPLAIANLATFGYSKVQIFRAPSLMLITTGNEVGSVGEVPGPAQIRNSNGPMLAAMARGLGVTGIDHRHAQDTMDDLLKALDLGRDADIVILTGAVSAGKYDLVPAAMEAFGATPVFHKVLQRPGKPILFAIRHEQLLFGLPGNPLSAHLGFHRYVAPAIRKLMGAEAMHPIETGELTEGVAIKGPRTLFQLAHVTRAEKGWLVTPLKGVGSADLHAAASANALVRFDPDPGSCLAGTRVLFEWTPPTLK